MIELASITSVYLWIKTAHIISATILLGMGFGSAFFKLQVDRSGDVNAIVFASKTVVRLDWLFTAPAVIMQFVTGLVMVRLGGYALTEAWLIFALGFFVLTGCCWIPAVYIQIRCRDLAVQAAQNGTPLPLEYRRLSGIWFWLGVVGFTSVWILVGLMVMKPAWAGSIAV
jgi:uncharacterized membrane protein